MSYPIGGLANKLINDPHLNITESLLGPNCNWKNSSSSSLFLSSSEEIILPMGKNSPNFTEMSDPMPDLLNSKDKCPPLLGGSQ